MISINLLIQRLLHSWINTNTEILIVNTCIVVGYDRYPAKRITVKNMQLMLSRLLVILQWYLMYSCGSNFLISSTHAKSMTNSTSFSIFLASNTSFLINNLEGFSLFCLTLKLLCQTVCCSSRYCSLLSLFKSSSYNLDSECFMSTNMG